jgi:hypothetical protein
MSQDQLSAHTAPCSRSNGCDTVLRGVWEADPRGRTVTCSDRCRAIRWRRQRQSATEIRDQELRALLEAALRKLGK